MFACNGLRGVNVNTLAVLYSRTSFGLYLLGCTGHQTGGSLISFMVDVVLQPAPAAAPAPLRGDFLTPRLSRSQETGLSIALIVISACELMALFYAYQNRYVKWESLWVIFVEVAPPPPPRPAPTSLTPSLSAVLPLCCLATAHVLRRHGGGARQRVCDV